VVPLRTVRFKCPPSNSWFDDDCRVAKRIIRRLERPLRRTETATSVLQLVHRQLVVVSTGTCCRRNVKEKLKHSSATLAFHRHIDKSWTHSNLRRQQRGLVTSPFWYEGGRCPCVNQWCSSAIVHSCPPCCVLRVFVRCLSLMSCLLWLVFCLASNVCWTHCQPSYWRTMSTYLHRSSSNCSIVHSWSVLYRPSSVRLHHYNVERWPWLSGCQVMPSDFKSISTVCLSLSIGIVETIGTSCPTTTIGLLVVIKANNVTGRRWQSWKYWRTSCVQWTAITLRCSHCSICPLPLTQLQSRVSMWVGDVRSWMQSNQLFSGALVDCGLGCRSTC